MLYNSIRIKKIGFCADKLQENKDDRHDLMITLTTAESLLYYFSNKFPLNVYTVYQYILSN